MDAPADERRVDARAVRAGDVVRHRVADGQHAAGGRAAPQRLLVDVGVRLAHGVRGAAEPRHVARHEPAGHRRRAAVGPHEVRVRDHQRQAPRRGRRQDVVARVVRVPRQRPAGQRREEAAREEAVGLLDARRRHAAGHKISLVVVAVAEDEGPQAPAGGPGDAVQQRCRRAARPRRERVVHEVARRDGGDRRAPVGRVRAVAQRARAAAHGLEPLDRVAAPLARVRQHDDALARPLQPPHELRRAVVRHLAVVDHAELVQEDGVVRAAQALDVLDDARLARGLPRPGRPRRRAHHAARRYVVHGQS